MRKLTIFACLFVFYQSRAQVEYDKVLHFGGGSLFGLAGAGIAKQASNGDRLWTFLGAVGGSALVGLGKEAIDSRAGGSGWDNEDLLATVLGGTTVGVTIDLFAKKKSKQKIRESKGLALSMNISPTKMPLESGKLPSLAALSMPQLFSK